MDLDKQAVQISMLSEIPSSPKNRTGWPWTEETSKEIYTSQIKWPRISIVTPSFNQGEFIEETIRSILLQNYPNLQYIIIDGGSTDDTVKILEKYSYWIDFWVSEADNGQSDAINKGLAHCNGVWFNWINSDDYLKPNAFAKMVEASITPEIKIIAGVTENIQNDIILGHYSAKIYKNQRFPWFSLSINQPGSLLCLEEVKKCGGVREDLNLCMDLDLWLRILLKCGIKSFVNVTDIVATYRYHSQSKTCSAEDVFALEEFSLMTDILKDSSKWQIPPSLAFLRQKSAINYKPNNNYNFTLEGDEIDRAYLERLLITDSLLFRAIVLTTDSYRNAFHYLKNCLNELRPRVEQIFTGDWKKIEAQTWLRAMQNYGYISLHGALKMIVAFPSYKTLRELIRIFFKGK